MLIKKATVLVLVSVMTTICFAQTNKQINQNKNSPDFSGKWKLTEINDTKDSSNPKSIFFNVTLNITSKDTEINVEKIRHNAPNPEQLTYYSDGRGESNMTALLVFIPSPTSRFFYTSPPPKSYQSKTFIKDGKLITEYKTITGLIQTRTVFSTSRDEWQLSSDGTKLVLTNSTLIENNNVPATSVDSNVDSNRNKLERQVNKYVFKRV